MTIIYQITLPKDQDAEAFVQFMQDEYLPAIHKGATRVGQVTNLVLLQGSSRDTTTDFFWHVGWNGLSSGHERIDDAKVQSKFESFHANVKEFGLYREVAGWNINETAR